MALQRANINNKQNVYKKLEKLSVELLNYLKDPSQEYQIKIFLKNLCRDLASIDNSLFYLKDGYIFNTKTKILYDKDNKEVKLTKNEIKFMEIMISKKGEFVSSSFLEYTIWEEESISKDCNKRLKYLIYKLRKKLPKNSIVNSYKLGYKLVSIF